MVQLASTITFSLAALASIVLAHPGHDVKAEAAERAAFLRKAPVQSRSLTQCFSKLKARGVEDRNVARRENAVQALRKKRGLDTGMLWDHRRRCGGNA